MDRPNTTQHAIRHIIVKNDASCRRTLLSFVAAAALLGYLFLAWENINAERQASDVKYISSLAQLNREINPESLHRFVTDVYALAERNECRSDILQAGTAVILADLDQISAAADHDKLVGPLKSADGYFSHSLSCAPTNGDTWARLAMIRLALGAPPIQIASLLERSRQFAPAEGGTLVARLAIWTRTSEATLNLASGALDWDLRLAFSRFSTSNVAEVLSQSSVAAQKRIVAIASSLPSDKIQRLRQSGLGFLPDPMASTAPLSH